MTRTYAALGVRLEPHWDLAAYEVRQQGAESDAKDAHVIHVRLSLANHATRAQPVPVLRLTLLDRYGKRIARRDLAPDEYWPRGHTSQSFLSADQRIDSEVAVRDPNADSASFELDVCLRSRESSARPTRQARPPPHSGRSGGPQLFGVHIAALARFAAATLLISCASEEYARSTRKRLSTVFQRCQFEPREQIFCDNSCART